MSEPTWRMNLPRDEAVSATARETVTDTPKGATPAFFTRRGRPEKNYRADIDGLRAIAVLSVILLHAGSTFVSGGFLGVDVFFVISGYLVHQQVTSRLATQSFSLFGFYGRRIWRTFPALYLIAALTLIAGAHPAHARRFRRAGA